MPPKAKNKARAFKSTSVTTKSSSSPSLDPPAPFKRAPIAYEPFLSNLQKHHVYIAHIDSKPRDFKQKIFLVPLVLNVAVIALVLWRIKVIGPWYMKICFSLMGKFNDMTIDTARTPVDTMAWEIIKRTAVFMIDLLIYVFVWLPFPWDFFVGRKSGSPVAWRLAVGYQNKEIIVRRSRKWYSTVGHPVEKGEDQEKLFAVVKKATDPMWMSEKTGYAMLNTEWDLDWKLMVVATKLVDNKQLTMDDFRTMTFVHCEEFGWMVIESAQAGGSAKEEEGRRKIVAFKDELTAMGKENLFFRWIELVQYESSRPGGFGPEQQRKTMEKARDLFEAQGVDFDRFWAKIGGMQGMPGMDEM
ncbi:uncharacterized protein LY89DRAFT_250000 [Mollisia scopiformis]|uniref:Uncharacterized protein n=1 Tax=Mollisia scopiformis TaxID=149040 RepID=A0A194WST2_MOLSC|nr:uncharacterized protein LY89DRAFT_250000 [Mollisia scopiformis]KUJ10739.1 hypothetical protein LY89DRAFT_250000 [Mollisia scopiformis]